MMTRDRWDVWSIEWSGEMNLNTDLIPLRKKVTLEPMAPDPTFKNLKKRIMDAAGYIKEDGIWFKGLN